MTPQLWRSLTTRKCSECEDVFLRHLQHVRRTLEPLERYAELGTPRHALNVLAEEFANALRAEVLGRCPRCTPRLADLNQAIRALEQLATEVRAHG
jgi:hypothetical protein